MALHPAAALSEIPPGARKIVTIGSLSIGIFNVDGTFRAYRNVCPHAGAPVCAGRVGATTAPSPVYEYILCRHGRVLRCPWHGWEFDLETGRQLVDPRIALKAVPVSVGHRETPEGASLENIPVHAVKDVLYVDLP